MLVIAFLFPIATHIATLVCYPNLKPKTIKPRIMADCKKCKGEVQNDLTEDGLCIDCFYDIINS